MAEMADHGRELPGVIGKAVRQQAGEGAGSQLDVRAIIGTLAQRESAARGQFECPRHRCAARPGEPCRSHVPQYTPMGFYHPSYGRVMTHIHPERLALLT